LGYKNPTNGQTIMWDINHGGHWDWQGVEVDGEKVKIRLRISGKGVFESDQELLKTYRQKNGLTPSGRGLRQGCVSAGMLASLLATTVIVGGVEYVYSDYVSSGEASGFKLATKVGLGEALMLADRDEGKGIGKGFLPGRSFSVIVAGNRVDVIIVNQNGIDYITASTVVRKWYPIYGSYPTIVNIITIEDGYKVYNVH